MKETTLKIEGMTCASCAQTIEKTLQKKNGVRTASVNFATEKAFVEYESGTIGVKDLEKAVKDAGYDVRSGIQKITFKLGGMTCTSCAATIEKALKKTGGVKSAVVNFATQIANVEFDPAVTGRSNTNTEGCPNNRI